MTDALLRQLALVSESNKVKFGDLARVGAALQKQAARDVVQFWDLKATVDAFPSLEDVPIGYWPIIVMDDIGYQAAGIHLDKNNEPFSLVTASETVDRWSLTASHEMIEMLVDPWGSRLVTGDSPKADQGRAQILVEPCDPSEAATYAYTVNGVLVSDFYGPLLRSRGGAGRPVLLYRRDQPAARGAEGRLPELARRRLEWLVAGYVVRRECRRLPQTGAAQRERRQLPEPDRPPDLAWDGAGNVARRAGLARGRAGIAFACRRGDDPGGNAATSDRQSQGRRNADPGQPGPHRQRRTASNGVARVQHGTHRLPPPLQGAAGQRASVGAVGFWRVDRL